MSRKPLGEGLIDKPEPKTFTFTKHTTIPWAAWGMRYKPSLYVGTVRVTRRMLLGVINELLQHIPKGEYDLTPIHRALELAQADVVIEVGKPEDRDNMATSVTAVAEVPPEGGPWITFSLGPIKEEE